jgi:hypothetical protein
MSGDEGVELALGWIWETADAFVSSESWESFPPSGENLVAISLMSNVPYYTVEWSIKHVMQGYGKFDGA